MTSGSRALKRARSQRVLVYGFGPYDHFDSNITAKALKKLAPRQSLKKVVFPARFNEAQFIHAIKKHRPDIILGLGQCSRGERFRIERRAVNRKRKRRSTMPKPIHVGGPKWLKTTLPLRSSRGATRSLDAGTYVCNFSMYVMLDYLRRNRLPARYGFIHIPFNMKARKVGSYLKKTLDWLEVPLVPSATKQRALFHRAPGKDGEMRNSKCKVQNKKSKFTESYAF